MSISRPRLVDGWQRTIAEIQDVALNETRLGIPVIYGIDAVHGHNYLYGGTVFPQNHAMAATWNPDLVKTRQRDHCD